MTLKDVVEFMIVTSLGLVKRAATIFERSDEIAKDNGVELFLLITFTICS